MKIYWKRLRPSDKASQRAIKQAKSDAGKHRKGELTNFEFTESDYEAVLLYNHIGLGQITPSDMRHMRRKDLYFIAGLLFPHPGLARPPRTGESKDGSLMSSGEFTELLSAEQRWEQLTKIQGNAIRAQQELKRRNFIWTSSLVILAALLGSAVAFV